MKEVIIYKLDEGIFYSKLICTKAGETIEIDARTSDAIAIGVRFKCAVYTYENILSSSGILLDETSMDEDEMILENTEEKETPKDTLETVTGAELQNKLNQAIDNEDYELASKIRDEINRRNAT